MHSFLDSVMFSCILVLKGVLLITIYTQDLKMIVLLMYVYKIVMIDDDEKFVSHVECYLNKQFKDLKRLRHFSGLKLLILWVFMWKWKCHSFWRKHDTWVQELLTLWLNKLANQKRMKEQYLKMFNPFKSLWVSLYI